MLFIYTCTYGKQSTNKHITWAAIWVYIQFSTIQQRSLSMTLANYFWDVRLFVEVSKQIKKQSKVKLYFMFKSEAFLRTTPTTQDSKRLTFVYFLYIWLYLSLRCVLVFNTIWQLDMFKLGSWNKTNSLYHEMDSFSI